jgi:ribosomal protein L37E
MTVLCERCGTTNLERSSICAGCGLGLTTEVDSRRGDKTAAAARSSRKRKWLTWKGGLLFVVIWALLVGEIVLYGGRVPKTTEGWVALIFLGPIGYIALAALLDSIFGQTNRKSNVQDDQPVA